MQEDAMLAIEFAENPETRCPVVLLLDTSSSMAGVPIAQLNEGIQMFRQEVEKDSQASLSVEVEIISIGGDKPKILQEFVTIDNFVVPELVANGMTPLGQAIHLGIEELQIRKDVYKGNDIPYYRPWLLALTDGVPTDEWESAAARLKQEEAANRLSFFIVGVGDRVNDDILRSLACSTPPIMMKGLKFQEMFKWLSASVRQVSQGQVGEVIALPPITWGTPG